MSGITENQGLKIIFRKKIEMKQANDDIRIFSKE